MSFIGDEPTTPAIAWNGRNGALNGPNADGAAVGHQGNGRFQRERTYNLSAGNAQV